MAWCVPDSAARNTLLEALIDRWQPFVDITRVDRLATAGFVHPDRDIHEALYDGAITSPGCDLPDDETDTSGLLLALEDELAVPESRDAFLLQLFARERLRRLFCGPWTTADLVAWNVSERFTLLAHDPKQHRMVGRVVSKPHDLPPGQLRRAVVEAATGAMRKRVTRRKHLYALEHIAELFGDRLSATERQEMTSAIAAFSSGDAPLIVPLVVLRHLGAVHGVHSLRGQTYLVPSPAELHLRFGS